MKCSVAGCVNKTFRRSVECPTHLYRRKHGIPLTLPIRYLRLEPGEIKTSIYRSWAMMKNRCLNPRATDWRYYGGRGIKLCKRWHDFRNFKKDMGPKPDDSYSIDRINNNLGYTPSNCRWATRAQQSRNRRFCK